MKEPELIQQITTNSIAEFEVEFTKILQEKFYIGMPEMELIRELSRQGFTPGWSYKKEPHSAAFVNHHIFCHFVWSVVWEVDKLGNLTKINGEFIDGCL